MSYSPWGHKELLMTKRTAQLKVQKFQCMNHVPLSFPFDFFSVFHL